MAAEIDPARDVDGRGVSASMRPRRMAAEIVHVAPAGRAAGELASMRPRRMAAEIGDAVTSSRRAWRRFNEAAANGRGNPTAIGTPSRRGSGFNEAAANGRGNRHGGYDDKSIDTIVLQ